MKLTCKLWRNSSYPACYWYHVSPVKVKKLFIVYALYPYYFCVFVYLRLFFSSSSFAPPVKFILVQKLHFRKWFQKARSSVLIIKTKARDTKLSNFFVLTRSRALCCHIGKREFTGTIIHRFLNKFTNQGAPNIWS